MRLVDLDKLQTQLEALADECLTLGTPFTVRRRIKAAILVLPTIKETRK